MHKIMKLSYADAEKSANLFEELEVLDVKKISF